MAQLPSDILRVTLELIAKNKAIILAAQEDYRLGNISRDLSLRTINAALDQIKQAEDTFERYVSVNRSIILSNGLSSTFAAAEREVTNAVNLGEQAYRFVRSSARPDRLAQGEQDRYQAKVKEYSEQFVIIQKIIDRAIQLCPTDKKQADTLFANGLDQLTRLKVQIERTLGEAKIPNIVSELNRINLSVNQAIPNATNARNNCQRSTPTVTVTTTANPANAAPTTQPVGPAATNPGQGDAQGLTARTRDQPDNKNRILFETKKDWRVRLSLAPESEYLYNATNDGILAPLRATNGVIFPYTPSVSVQYNARYDSTPLTHSNYTFYNYSGSSVDQVMITCDFTAQDTQEANYLLAVIHFFRSATKMFYGKDEDPKAGTPPPLCYLYGYGQFQFSAHPLVISGFTFSLPDDCDYIRAGVGSTQIAVPNSVPQPITSNSGNTRQARLSQGSQSGTGQTLVPGGNLSPTSLQDNKGFNSVIPSGTEDPTYVPTKIQLQIMCLPIVSRYDVANKFSLDQYASGALLRGTGEGRTGGMW